MAHVHSIYDTDLHFIIDPITRKITSESGKVTLMQTDHNSERFTFEIPRFIEGHDMSLTDKVEIHYINLEATSPKRQAKAVYPASDLQVSPDSDDVVIFSWLISGAATQYVGSLSFIARFVCHGEESEIIYQWWTDAYSQIKIAATMDNTNSVIDLDDTDLIEAWRQDCIRAVESSGIYEKAEALAKSYAVGGTGTRAGEDTDNAKYYMEKTKTYVGTDVTEVINALDGDEIYPALNGKFLHSEDATNEALYSMQLFGKVESDSEGTIDAPSTLHIPGNDGVIGVTLTKKNLWTYSATKTFNNVVHSEGVYTVNGACSANVHTLPEPIPAGTPCAVTIQFTEGKLSITAGGIAIGGYNVDPDGNTWQCAVEFPKYTEQSMDGVKLTKAVVVDKPVTDFFIFFYGPSITIHEPVSFKVMFEIADEPTGYQAYSAQTMSVTPPSELVGIKIPAMADARNGNYTDIYGNAWMTDEIDFAAGVYRKHITKFVFDGTEAWYINNTANAKTNRFMLGSVIQKTPVGGPVYGIVSNIATFAGTSISASFDTENQCMAYGFNHQKGWLGFAVNAANYPTVDSFKARLAELYTAGTPVVAYIAERIDPTVTALSEDQIAAFKALKSYYSVLNVFNDSGAEMSITYRADSTLYKEQNGIPTTDEMYLGKNEVAKRAVEDALGNNIPNTYQRKDEAAMDSSQLGGQTAEAWQTKLDNIQTTSKATLSQAGWYRVAEYKPTTTIENSLKGIASNSCTLILKRRYNSRNSEHHEIKLSSRFEVQRFVSANSNALSGNHHITKVRYTYTTDTAYIEIYYDHSGANGLLCEIADSKDMNGVWQAITPTLTEETVDGVTVTTTYDIPANASPVTDLDLDARTKCQAMPTGTDLNDINEQGIYFFDGLATNYVNTPSNTAHNGIMTVDTYEYPVYGTITGVQRYTSMNLGVTFERVRKSSTWQGWKQLTTTADLTNYFKNTGGSINGYVGINAESWFPLGLNNTANALSYLRFSGKGEVLGYLGFAGKNLLRFVEADGNTGKAILHEGNYEDYTIAKDGGGVVQAASALPVALRNTVGAPAYLQYTGTSGNLGSLGFRAKDTPVFLDSTSAIYQDLLHTGNSAKVLVQSTPLTAEGSVRVW